MKKIVYLILCLFFVGCTVQPDTVVVVEKETKVVTVDENLTKYVEIDNTAIEALDTSTKDKTIRTLSIYTLYLQSVIMKYEERMDSIKDWSNKVKIEIEKPKE